MLKMEVIIKCPDCGKDLKVTVEEVAPEVVYTQRVETKTSWSSLKKKIQENARENFAVDDEVSCTLKDGTDVTFVVASINPYGDNQIAFVLKDALPGEYRCMNEECTNKGGWRDSDMREYLSTHVYDLLPDELKAIITKRTIVQKQDGAELKSEDDIWCLSATEIDGKEHKADVGDVHFELFKDERSRVKQNGEETTYYSTRTAWASYSPSFANVTNNGFSNYHYATHAYSIVFGFLA